MEKAPLLEKNEMLKKLELVIEEPELDKNFKISFVSQNENENAAYNRAISVVCEKNNINIFHQVGSSEKTGYQAWEIWSKINKDALSLLIPEIQKKASDYLSIAEVNKPEILLKQATLNDVEKILELQRKASSPYAFRGLDNEEEARQGIADDISKIHMLLIKEEEMIIGSAGYDRKETDKDNAYISSFLVDPDFQGQGRSTVAFEKLLNELNDCKKIVIDTGKNNEGMRKLLDKFGYKKTSEYAIDNGEIIYRLLLEKNRPVLD